jgi:hypothetical protein
MNQRRRFKARRADSKHRKTDVAKTELSLEEQAWAEMFLPCDERDWALIDAWNRSMYSDAPEVWDEPEPTPAPAAARPTAWSSQTALSLEDIPF